MTCILIIVEYMIPVTYQSVFIRIVRIFIRIIRIFIRIIISPIPFIHIYLILFVRNTATNKRYARYKTNEQK